MKVIDYRTGEYVEVIQAYRNQANYQSGEFVKDKEVNEEPSMTVPDMSFSIPEILKKYTRGVAPNVQRLGLFAEKDGFDDVNPTDDPSFDLADATALLEEIEKRMKENKLRKTMASKQVTDEGGNEEKKPEDKKVV